MAESPLTARQAVEAMPISPAAKKQFIHLLTTTEDQTTEVAAADKYDYLYSISYRDFLSKHLGISENDVFDVLQDLASDSGVGIDSVSALSAMSSGGLPRGLRLARSILRRWPKAAATTFSNIAGSAG